MGTKTTTLCDMLQWVFLDKEYLPYICNWIDVDEIEAYGETHINILLQDILKQEAEKFIGAYQYEIWEILEIPDIKKHLAENQIYEINLDLTESHITFYDENIQQLFKDIKHLK